MGSFFAHFCRTGRAEGSSVIFYCKRQLTRAHALAYRTGAVSKSFGITYNYAGENIAMGYSSPEAVMTAWMNSAGHRANILSANFTTLGVGYGADGGYWTQWFIG